MASRSFSPRANPVSTTHFSADDSADRDLSGGAPKDIADNSAGAGESPSSTGLGNGGDAVKEWDGAECVTAQEELGSEIMIEEEDAWHLAVAGAAGAVEGCCGATEAKAGRHA